jgi:integrase
MTAPNRMKFTDRALKALKPGPARYEVWEQGRPGFGMRVATSGIKSFIYFPRLHGETIRLTLGRYPLMSLSKAHIAHAEAADMIRHGIDPRPEKQDRERTVQALFDLYAAYLNSNSKRRVSETTKLFNANVAPRIGTKLATDIVRDDIIRLLKPIEDRGALVMRNRIKAIVAAMFNFGIQEQWVTTNPAAQIKPLTEEPRDRALKRKEIAAFWSGMHRTDLTESEQIAFRMILLTACRRNEVLWAEKTEFDFDELVWEIPGARTQNGIPHALPITPAMLPLIQRAFILSGNSRYLFPSRSDNEKKYPPTQFSAVMKRNVPKWGIEPATVHDLRRTAYTEWTSLGISPEVRERLVNHRQGKLQRTYNKHEYLPEKRTALVAWENHVAEIAAEAPKPDNVREIHHAAA